MFSVFDFSTILQFGTFLTFCSSVTFSSLFLFRVSASVFLSVCKFSRSSTPKPPASSAFFQSSDPQFWDPWEPFSFFFFFFATSLYFLFFIFELWLHISSIPWWASVIYSHNSQSLCILKVLHPITIHPVKLQLIPKFLFLDHLTVHCRVLTVE